MNTIVFDSHALIKRLRSAGFTEEQAEAIAEPYQSAISQLVIREDLRLQLDSLRVIQKLQLDAFRVILKQELILWLGGIVILIGVATSITSYFLLLSH
jgi:hypothetical protein